MSTIAGRCLGTVVALLLIAVGGRAAEVSTATCDQTIATLSAGQLTVSSQGCSLRQVLNAISHETGIETNMPGSAGTIPVFATLGPGQPARIVSSLLEGLPFNSSLVAKADGSGKLLRVALTARLAPPVMTAVESNKTGAAKKNDATSLASVPDVYQYEQPSRRAELDDSTLKKLPALPPGVPSSMWALYPGIAQSVADNGGSLPSFPASSTFAQSAPPVTASGQAFAVPSDPGAVPKGAIGLPQLPPGIDPNIGKLYPWNLMQLIQGGFQPSYPPVPPMAGPISLTPPPPTGH
jgi:hypothetical protein